MSWGTVLNTAVNLYDQYQNQQNQNNTTNTNTAAASNQSGWTRLLQTAANAYIAYNNSKNQQDSYNAQLAASKEPQVQTRSPYASNIVSALAPMIMQQQMQNYNDAVKRMGGKGFAGDMSTNPLMQLMTQMMQNPNLIGGTQTFGGQLTPEQQNRIYSNFGISDREGPSKPNIANAGSLGGDFGATRGINQQDVGLINDAQQRYNATLGDNPSIMDRMGLDWYNLPGSQATLGRIPVGQMAYGALGIPSRIPIPAPQTDEQKAIWASIPQFNSRYADFTVDRGGSGNDALDRMGYSSGGIFPGLGSLGFMQNYLY